ncbi:hypothetical protein BC567DRAFT_49999 [Phyllosticta citribraziliensis]
MPVDNNAGERYVHVCFLFSVCLLDDIKPNVSLRFSSPRPISLTMTPARCGCSHLTIAFSSFMLFFNAILLACVAYFSSQLPFGISGSFIAYFSVASALCLLGLVGSVKRFEPFVSIFANHVLLDAILLTIPRIAFLAFLSTLPTSICSASDFPNFFLPPTSPTLPGTDTTRIHAYAGSYGGAATSNGHFWSKNRDQCFVVVNTLMGVAACLAVMTGVAQWCVALRVRKFAQALRRQCLVEQAVEGDQVVVVTVDEKRGLEKV